MSEVGKWFGLCHEPELKILEVSTLRLGLQELAHRYGEYLTLTSPSDTVFIPGTNPLLPSQLGGS